MVFPGRLHHFMIKAHLKEIFMLKTLMFSFALMASASLASAASMPTAPSVRSSWESILSNRAVTVDFPQIAFGANRVSVANVCLDGETLRTLQPVTICGQYSQGGLASNVCDQEVSVQLATPRTFQGETCDYPYGLQGGCQPRVVTYQYPLTFDAQVFVGTTTSTMGGNRELLFTKSFTIANCE
jgi:hypothetical protein